MPNDASTHNIISLIRRIPEGRVATYGQIAALANRPKNARQVGAILRSLPDKEENVPWHRVVNAQGRISDRGNETAEGLQKFLLLQEGVVVSDEGRIDIRTYQWKRTR